MPAPRVLLARLKRRLHTMLIATVAVAIALGGPLVAASTSIASAFVSTAEAAEPAAPARSAGEYLMVSDPTAQAAYLYRGSDHKLTGRLDDIALSTHAGTLQLPNGRVIAVDDDKARIVEIAITANGRPRITQSAQIPGEWEGAAWAAADAGLRYFAVSGGSEEAPTITVVDLRTFTVHQLAITAEPDSSGNTPETQVYLAGRPLQLVYTTGGKFRTVPLSAVLAGRTPTTTSTIAVGPGTHGPVVSRRGDAVYSTTIDGLDGASISGATLAGSVSIPYSATRNIVQVYRPRLAGDGRTVWGSAAEDTGLAPGAWADTRNDVNIIDTATRRSSLVRLPDGIAGRLAISRSYAAVTTIHPDGDVLTLLDASTGSSTYKRVVGTLALPPLTNGPKPGTPTTGTQSHFTTLNPSGSTAYVSQGGDGQVSVIDTATRQIIDTINTPNPLAGGGYLTVIHKGTPVADLVAR